MAERVRRPRVSKTSSPGDLAERAKELRCLIAVSRDLADRRRTVSESLGRAIESIPSGWRFPELAAVRITWREQTWSTRGFRATSWSMTRPLRGRSDGRGAIEVAYRSRPPGPAPTFLPEEAPLLEAIADRVADVIELREAERELAAYQDRLRSLASQLAITEERQRRDIATYLHDHIGQELALIKLRLEGLRGSAREPEQNRVLDQVCELAADVLRNTRTLTFEVSPPILHELGLAPALEWLADHMRSRHGLPVDVEAERVTAIDDDTKVLVFRSANELLNNVVRHAQASRAVIRARSDARAIRVEVEDDGVGFDPQKVASDRSFGLFSIRERLAAVGGELELVSAPGRGTRATIQAPLAKARRRRR